MDVVFEDTAVGGLQCQQVLIPSLDGLQPVFCVLCLSLIRGRPKDRDYSQKRDRHFAGMTEKGKETRIDGEVKAQ